MTLSVAQKNSLEAATAAYGQALAGSPAATYLRDRGIDETAARTARLGYVETPANGHEHMRGMLCLPYLTPAGVVGLKFRRLDDGQPKYMIPTGQRTHIYNVLAFREQEHSIAVSEGELDTLTLHRMCGIPAVGIPGVQSWRPWYARCFDGYETVRVFADNDVKEDGSNPGMDLARRILEEVPQAQLVVLPANMDVNALYCAGGREAVVSLIDRRM